MGYVQSTVADQPHIYILTEAHQCGPIPDAKNMLMTANPFPTKSYTTAQAHHKHWMQTYKCKAHPPQLLLSNHTAIQHTLVHPNKTKRLRPMYRDIKNLCTDTTSAQDTPQSTNIFITQTTASTQTATTTPTLRSSDHLAHTQLCWCHLMLHTHIWWSKCRTYGW